MGIRELGGGIFELNFQINFPSHFLTTQGGKMANITGNLKATSENSNLPKKDNPKPQAAGESFQIPSNVSGGKSEKIPPEKAGPATSPLGEGVVMAMAQKILVDVSELINHSQKIIEEQEKERLAAVKENDGNPLPTEPTISVPLGIDPFEEGPPTP